MKIKVCGLRQEKNIAEVLRLAPDYVGFIFVPESPRYVRKQISKSLLQELRGTCNFVGVLRAPSADQIAELSNAYALDIIQLHGDETPDDCQKLRDAFPGLQFWKAISVADVQTLNTLESYRGVVDALLLDSNRGGSGKKFDWSLLDHGALRLPFYLSGGITPQDTAALKEIAARQPALVGVDINSKFEINPAQKDVALVRKFFQEIRL